MQEIESAVRDLGGSAMQGIDHAVKGLKVGTVNRQKILNHKQDGRLPSAPTQGD